MLSLALCGGVAAGANGAATFKVDPIAPGVFEHPGLPLALDVPGHDDIANIGFIVGRRCVAVIDTGGSVAIGRALHAAIRKHTSLPICYVINTHVHVDHVLGNFAFKGDHPKFVGNATLARAMARNRPFFLEHYAGDLDAPAMAAEVIGPDVLVEKDLDLDLGARSLHLHAWPKAHTDSDLTVFDETSGTLWTGDLVFRQRLPALDGSVLGWIAVLDQLAKMKTVCHVVPGHGPVGDNLDAAIAPERRYLIALVAGVRAELAKGQSVQHAISHVALDEKPHWLLWDSVEPGNVARAWDELQWE